METDRLHDLFRAGFQQFIASAVEAELAVMLSPYADRQLEDGWQAGCRNGFLPERRIQTGIDDLKVKVPKIRNRSGNGMHFNSALLPSYLKRATSLEELPPWLQLGKISTGAFHEALAALFGAGAYQLSASTISRLKAHGWMNITLRRNLI